MLPPGFMKCFYKKKLTAPQQDGKTMLEEKILTAPQINRTTFPMMKNTAKKSSVNNMRVTTEVEFHLEMEKK